jgi:hypothetical protein
VDPIPLDAIYILPVDEFCLILSLFYYILSAVTQKSFENKVLIATTTVRTSNLAK